MAINTAPAVIEINIRLKREKVNRKSKGLQIKSLAVVYTVVFSFFSFFLINGFVVSFLLEQCTSFPQGDDV